MSVLVKATQALDILERRGRPVRLQELSDELELPKSSVHRLVTELNALGLVRKAESSGFVLGPRLMLYGQAANRSFDLAGLARGPMESLRDDVLETVHLYVRLGSRRVCVQVAEGRHFLRPASEVGRTAPLGAGAAGRVLFAFAPDDVVDEVRRLTGQNGTPLPDEDELAAIRAEAWSVSESQIEPGLAAGAAGIRTVSGAVDATVGVAGSAARLDSARLLSLKPRVQACAEEISQILRG